MFVFSRVQRDSTPRFVRPSVGRLVGLSVGRSVTFYFFYVYYFLTLLLLPKCSSDLKYSPCPPARDWSSRVSGLVYLHACLSVQGLVVWRITRFQFSYVFATFGLTAPAKMLW